MKQIRELTDKLVNKTIEEQFQIIDKIYGKDAVLSTSFQLEDQVLTHLVFEQNLDIQVFTIDTGRQFEEVYKTMNKTIKRYKKNIKVYYPDTQAVEKLVSEKGPYSFYESVENRKECCHIRKVVPLNRSLEGKKLWITGLRHEQSSTRKDLAIIEWDEKHNIIKFNPLIDWTLEQVRDFITKNNIPYNVMQDNGYPSVGCAPCTRAVRPGEDMRAGRWWWENNSKKECGLHVKD